MPKTILDSHAKKASVYPYRLTGKVDWEDLAKVAHNPALSLNADLSRMGLVHPLTPNGSAPEEAVVEAFDGGYVTALRVDKSVVTATAIRQAIAIEIANRLEGLPDDQGLGRQEKAAIAEAIRGQLLSASPEVTKYVPILIDTVHQRVVVFDTSEKLVNVVLHYFNNVFAGNISLHGLPQLAVKAGIPNTGVKLLEILQELHAGEGENITDYLFRNAPGMSFGTGIKLSKLDGESGNTANLPGFDLTDESLLPMLERASFVDRLGLFLAHHQSDIEFQINASLQFTKMGLNGLLADGQTDDQDEHDIAAQLRATAILLADALHHLTTGLTGFLGLPEVTAEGVEQADAA